MNDVELLRKMKGCRSRLKSEVTFREFCARVRAVNFVELDLKVTSGDVPGSGQTFTMTVDSPVSRLMFTVESRSWDGKHLRCVVTSNLLHQPAYESARVEVEDVWIGIDTGCGWEDVRVLDVSREGMAILTKETPRPGDTLHLRISHAGADVDLSASARYCRELTDRLGYRRVGMELYARTRADQAKWLSVYDRLVNAA